jgi:DNA-binding response OmpR family regulator
MASGLQDRLAMAVSARVLVVDDDEVVLDLLREVLASEGYDVTVALNGVEALSQVVDRSFELMITDLGLSGLNGLDLIAATKHCRPRMPIIVLTASHEQAMWREAVRLGADRVVLKPQGQRGLLALVHLMLHPEQIVNGDHLLARDTKPRRREA